MKVKSFQITALSSQLQQGFDAILFYGTDEGEIDFALTQLKQELKLGQRTENFFILSKEALKKTPLLATDEANTASLISERRFLFIPEDASFPVASLLHFLEHKQTDALLIIQGGNLTKTNTLRVEAEKNPRVLAVACYQPTLLDIQKNISHFFVTHHKKITPDVLNEICQKIPFNQHVIEKELDKLLLYLGDEEEVTSFAVQECITDGSQSSLERLCIDLADGQSESVQRDIHLFLASGEQETVLLRAVRDYFELLLLIVSDTSAPVTSVIKKYLKPAQFRLEAPLIRQASRWQQKAVLSVLDKLSQLEQRTRTTGLPKESIIAQAFLSLSQFARKSAGLR